MIIFFYDCPLLGNICNHDLKSVIGSHCIVNAEHSQSRIHKQENATKERHSAI